MHAWIEINKKSLINNFVNIKKISSHSIGAVIKANAYGHGLIEISKCIAENNLSNYFLVQYEDEALILSNLKLNKKILILSPYFCEYFFKNNNFEYTVYSIESLKEINKLSIKYNKKTLIHLKFDTGMNRLGLKFDDIKIAINIILNNNNLKLIGILTHFHDTRIFDTSTSNNQIEKLKIIFNYFNNIFKKLIIHTFPSGAIDLNSLFENNKNNKMVRSGSFIYGFYKSEENKNRLKSINNDFEIKQIITLKSKILQIKNVNQFETIGYGTSFKAKEPMIIAIISIGYSHGFNFKLTQDGYIVINKQYAKIFGYICMGMLIVDITNLKDINLNSEVLILSPDYEKINVEYVSKILDISNICFTSTLNPLLKKIII